MILAHLNLYDTVAPGLHEVHKRVWRSASVCIANLGWVYAKAFFLLLDQWLINVSESMENHVIKIALR